MAKLTFFCGKMGAGKSTLARKMAAQNQAALLSEDEWLASLFPGQIASLDDYVRFSGRLKGPVKGLVQTMLAAGTDVVMDFPANTMAQRAWFRELLDATSAEHELVFLDLSDAACLARIERRRLAEPSRAATDTADMFAAVARYFQAPMVSEGFNVVNAGKPDSD